MSEKNVEIVRQIYEAFRRRDSEAPYKHFAPDIEWDVSRNAMLVDTAVYRGHSGVRASFRDLLEAFDFIEYELEQCVDVGPHVLASIHERYRGRGSGVEVDNRHFALWSLHEGKVVRMCVYRDRAEALEAVGLSE
jgi:ketosteroid isomerase-like protein